MFHRTQKAAHKPDVDRTTAEEPIDFDIEIDKSAQARLARKSSCDCVDSEACLPQEQHRPGCNGEPSATL